MDDPRRSTTQRTAHAETSAASAACSLRLGSVTATGAHTSRGITATSPISIGGVRETAGVFQPNQGQHTTPFVGTPLLSGESAWVRSR